MTEAEKVPAPFDAVPDDASGPDETTGTESTRRPFLGGWKLALVFLIFAGLGHAVTLLFVRGESDLSSGGETASESSGPAPDADSPSESDRAEEETGGAAGPRPRDAKSVRPSVDEAGTGAGAVPAPAAPPTMVARDDLWVARQRLDAGDVDGARRIAAAWALRMDGFAPDEAARAPMAYAILAEVLRRDYERTRFSGGDG